jgi:hypothetical protein
MMTPMAIRWVMIDVLRLEWTAEEAIEWLLERGATYEQLVANMMEYHHD